MRSFPRRTDMVARYGGDEFVVVLPDAGLGDSRRLAERLLVAVRALVIQHEDRVLRVTASCGISELAPGETVVGWLERTDQGLYRAKEAGRDQVGEAPSA